MAYHILILDMQDSVECKSSGTARQWNARVWTARPWTARQCGTQDSVDCKTDCKTSVGDMTSVEPFTPAQPHHCFHTLLFYSSSKGVQGQCRVQTSVEYRPEIRIYSRTIPHKLSPLLYTLLLFSSIDSRVAVDCKASVE